MKKILTICKIQKEILEKYHSQIIYRPHLNEFLASEWEELVKSVKPDIVLFGTIHFTREMMRIWRENQPDDKLSIVRKGISLGRCDLPAAKEYQIDVFNLPGVNSFFVAGFMKKYLFRENKATDSIAIIGTGTIGQRIINEAVSNNIPLIIYNKTVKNHNDLEKIKWFSDLPADYDINVAATLDEAFSHASKIAISLPYNNDTKGFIDKHQIDLIPSHALLISVSEPKIFSEDALRTLYKRNDLFVVIDHLAAEFEDIYKIMGCDARLRKDFFMVEDAATSVECQQAMSGAAIEKCLEICSD